MANRAPPKFMSTVHATYQSPYRDHTDYKFYHPQLFINYGSAEHTIKKDPTKWFQDFRRSYIEEKVRNKNLKSLNSPLRPTRYSDKPDTAMGARKQALEGLLPVIHNKPVYLLTNRNHDRARDRDQAFMSDMLHHREQYRVLTGSKHKREERFYYPFAASESFTKRNLDMNNITDYPDDRTSALEFVYEKERANPLVYHKETDVSI